VVNVEGMRSAASGSDPPKGKQSTRERRGGEGQQTTSRNRRRASDRNDVFRGDCSLPVLVSHHANIRSYPSRRPSLARARGRGGPAPRDRRTTVAPEKVGVRTRSPPRHRTLDRRPGETRVPSTRRSCLRYREAPRNGHTCMGRGWDARRDRSVGGSARSMRRGIVHCIAGVAAPRPRSEAAAPAYEPSRTRKKTAAPGTRSLRRALAGPTAQSRHHDENAATTSRTLGTGAGWLVGTVFLEGLPLAVRRPGSRGRPQPPRNRRPIRASGRSLAVRHIDLRKVPEAHGAAVRSEV
jgi:hypothetical protein